MHQADDTMAQRMRPHVQDAFDDILDTFSAADGGRRFVRLITVIRALDEAAAKGDMLAADALHVMIKFRRLIQVANKEL